MSFLFQAWTVPALLTSSHPLSRELLQLFFHPDSTFQSVHVFLVLVATEQDTALVVGVVSSVLRRREASLLVVLSTVLLMQSRIPLALAAGAHWLMFNLMPTRTARHFFTFQLVAPCGVVPSYRALHFSLLNCMRFQSFLSAHRSILLSSFWMVAQPSNKSTTVPTYLSSTNLMKVRSASSFRLLMKK